MMLRMKPKTLRISHSRFRFMLLIVEGTAGDIKKAVEKLLGPVAAR